MDKDTLQHNPPPIPLIADESGNNVGYRDTLDRVAAVLQLLNEMDLSEGLSPRAKSGHYWEKWGQNTIVSNINENCILTLNIRVHFIFDKAHNGQSSLFTLCFKSSTLHSDIFQTFF